MNHIQCSSDAAGFPVVAALHCRLPQHLNGLCAEVARSPDVEPDERPGCRVGYHKHGGLDVVNLCAVDFKNFVSACNSTAEVRGSALHQHRMRARQPAAADGVAVRMVVPVRHDHTREGKGGGKVSKEGSPEGSS